MLHFEVSQPPRLGDLPALSHLVRQTHAPRRVPSADRVRLTASDQSLESVLLDRFQYAKAAFVASFATREQALVDQGSDQVEDGGR